MAPAARAIGPGPDTARAGRRRAAVENRSGAHVARVRLHAGWPSALEPGAIGQ
jgi:hypothetical protein